MLKRVKELLSQTKSASMVVCAEDVPSILESLPEPSTSRQTDPLETSLVESGLQLVSLDPFEGEEEIIHPTSTGAARIISQTISVESNITKPLKIIGGKGPKSAGGKDPKSAGGKDLKSAGGKDLKSAGARPKTAFTLPANLGKWEFLCCPFGLAQAPAYFQRLINEVLAPFDFAFGYLDDILIYSPDVQTHLKHLELIFQ